jgi:hypothetical protein
MLAHEADYTPEALAAAHAEIGRRDLSPARIGELDALSREIIARDLEAARLPLSWPVRLTMFAFPMGVIQWIAADRYRGMGYTRKANECWKWMRFGLCFWAAFWLLIGLTNR